jgi:hypothetical protein
MTPTMIYGGLAGWGAAIFVMAVVRALETGPGSGFKGYTTGFRVRLWLSFVFGLAFVAIGVMGLLRLR